jgi:DNA-binding response OmpR family regulator
MSIQFPLILVIDDDPIITRTLSLNLQADGYDVITAASGGEALRVLEQRLPDLAIVDLLLPDMHGFELCKRIKQYLDLPMVMLTAVGTEETVIAGLEQYAEDYVVKPFSYKQLLARIARVLKRTRAVKPAREVVRLADGVEVDFARRVVRVGARGVRLTPAESRALACLARRANQCVSNATLLSEVWTDGEGDEDRLWVLINRLRHKVEPDPKKPIYLLNERGVGYRLVANGIRGNT